MDKIQEKIAKLLALAESPNENEAREALLKARALMVENKLHPDDIGDHRKQEVVRGMTDITCTKMTNSWAVMLAGVIAKHHCCIAFRDHYPRDKKVTIGFYGLQDDYEVCTSVFKYAYACAVRGCDEVKRQYKEHLPAPSLRLAATAYGNGFAAGLSSAYQEQTASHSQEWGLVVAVPAEVKKAASGLGKGKRYGKTVTGQIADACKQKGKEDGVSFGRENLRSTEKLSVMERLQAKVPNEPREPANPSKKLDMER